MPISFDKITKDCKVVDDTWIDDMCDEDSKYRELCVQADADEHRRYPTGLLMENEECHTCGSTLHSGECQGSFNDDVENLPSALDNVAKEEVEKFLLEDSEKDAMKRFFAGEEPGFSTGICGSLTAGYGQLDESGYWEYQLPYPAEQWLKKKDFDLKVKINGMKYKARIIAFDSDEIIKRNFVQYCTDPAFGFGKRSIEVLKASYDRCIEKLKETRDASLFLETMTAGDSVKEHNHRVYLEIVDETYPAAGSISSDL